MADRRIRAAAYEIASPALMAAHRWQQVKPVRLRLAYTVLDRRTAELGLSLRASA